jgi:hypothetical protein
MAKNRHGKVRQDKTKLKTKTTRQKARQCKARQGKIRQCKTRQDKTRQAKTRQGKTNICPQFSTANRHQSISHSRRSVPLCSALAVGARIVLRHTKRIYQGQLPYSLQHNTLFAAASISTVGELPGKQFVIWLSLGPVQSVQPPGKY